LTCTCSYGLPKISMHSSEETKTSEGWVRIYLLIPLLQGLAILSWGCAALPQSLSPDQVLLLVFSILGGACIFAGLYIIQGKVPPISWTGIRGI
jgi:hypothetical protein